MVSWLGLHVLLIGLLYCKMFYKMALAYLFHFLQLTERRSAWDLSKQLPAKKQNASYIRHSQAKTPKFKSCCYCHFESNAFQKKYKQQKWPTNCHFSVVLSFLQSIMLLVLPFQSMCFFSFLLVCISSLT